MGRDGRIENDSSWNIIHDGGNLSQRATFTMESHWTNLQKTRYALHIYGSQPFSPRLFEAIVAGAVPIIISPGFVLPFEEVLDWAKFSVRVDPAQAGSVYDIINDL